MRLLSGTFSLVRSSMLRTDLLLDSYISPASAQTRGLSSGSSYFAGHFDVLLNETLKMTANSKQRHASSLLPHVSAGLRFFTKNAEEC